MEWTKTNAPEIETYVYEETYQILGTYLFFDAGNPAQDVLERPK